MPDAGSSAGQFEARPHRSAFCLLSTVLLPMLSLACSAAETLRVAQVHMQADCRMTAAVGSLT